MDVVVFGATGNVGTSLVQLLQGDPEVTSIRAVARRQPDLRLRNVTWVHADVARSDLHAVVAGADAVVHLAWLLQPSRNEAELWATNVEGTRRILEAVADQGVSALVYASSVGAYSAAPPGTVVDESWPTDGVATSPYSRQKAYTERQLDAFEARHPDVRVVRLRPALILKPGAASHIRRLFAGPFLPTRLLRAFGLPVWPATPGLSLQFVGSHDVARAYHLALQHQVRGAFNIAAEPVIDATTAREALDARPVPVPAAVLRSAAAATWRLRMHPADPGWIDLALGAPTMSARRAHSQLDWSPQQRADKLLAEFVAALGRRDGLPTPPLAPDASGTLRLDEIRTGVGGTST